MGVVDETEIEPAPVTPESGSGFWRVGFSLFGGVLADVEQFGDAAAFLYGVNFAGSVLYHRVFLRNESPFFGQIHRIPGILRPKRRDNADTE